MIGAPEAATAPAQVHPAEQRDGGEDNDDSGMRQNNVAAAPRMQHQRNPDLPNCTLPASGSRLRSNRESVPAISRIAPVSSPNRRLASPDGNLSASRRSTSTPS